MRCIEINLSCVEELPEIVNLDESMYRCIIEEVNKYYLRCADVLM